jgi:hypothetical protein
MHFVYDGFTHERDRRCFTFRSVEEHSPVSVFCIEVDLMLFVRNHVPVQEGPMFCLQLLTAACAAEPNFIERFQNYQVLAEDFRPLLVERERRAAEKAMRKPPRRLSRKPQSISNIRLTASPE